MNNFAMQLLVDKKLTGREWDLLMSLTSNLTFDNLVLISQIDFAEQLKTTPKVVHHALKKLRENGCVKKVKRNKYMINPHYFFKGDDKNYKQLCETYADL